MRAIAEGDIEVLMFSINYVYDMLPGTEDVNDLWADEVYEGGFTNMDPERQRLYELCEDRGVGITVMKAFAGGDILDEKLLLQYRSASATHYRDRQSRRYAREPEMKSSWRRASLTVTQAKRSAPMQRRLQLSRV